jgi:hypothetical protein
VKNQAPTTWYHEIQVCPIERTFLYPGTDPDETHMTLTSQKNADKVAASLLVLFQEWSLESPQCGARARLWQTTSAPVKSLQVYIPS